MNVYKNTITGVVVMSDSELSGSWELIEPKKIRKSTKKSTETVNEELEETEKRAKKIDEE